MTVDRSTSSAADPRRTPTVGLQLATPVRQLADAPLAIRVRGVPVDDPLVLQLTARWWSGELLSAVVRFIAVDGTIDVARDAPVDGYAGVEPDGLLRTLQSVAEAASGPTRANHGARPVSAASGLVADQLEVRAWTDSRCDQPVAAMIRREACDAAVQLTGVRAAGVSLLRYAQRVAVPDSVALFVVPSVGLAGTARAAALLASHGHVVVAPTDRRGEARLASMSTAVLGEVARGSPSATSRAPRPALIVGLDVVPDRRRPAAVRAWAGLLERLRDLSRAPMPRR